MANFNGRRDGTFVAERGQRTVLNGDRLMAVDLKTNAHAFEAGIQRMLFEAAWNPLEAIARYQVAENGRRFLLNLPLESSSPVTVTVNWAANAKQ